MAIELPPLPWAGDALAPHISKETIDYHYGKHHQTYVTKLNELIAGTANAGKSLEEIVKSSQGPVFNNSAQVWNHTFYWNSLKPKGGGQPTGAVATAIKDSFSGGYDAFRKEFTDAAISQFGSGWAWLVKDGGKLKVVKTPNAETPLTTSAKALLTCDVWEHAYYIDYRNARAKYVEIYFDHLVNWDFANANIA
jgi:Fe-Mn family superoxide dismutase